MALEQHEGIVWTMQELKERAFDPWYRANKFLNPDLSRDEYWFEFLEARRDVKVPLGEGILDRAWKEAEDRTIPQAAIQFEDPEIRQLVLWCQEMQRLSGEEPFFLSCNSVQGRFGLVSPRRAHRRLCGLVEHGILEEVVKGKVGTRKATSFRYLPPLEDAQRGTA